MAHFSYFENPIEENIRGVVVADTLDKKYIMIENLGKDGRPDEDGVVFIQKDHLKIFEAILSLYQLT